MLKIVVFKNWFQLCNHELFKLQCVIIGLHPTFVCFFTALQMQCLDKFSSTFSMSETFIIWNLISYWSQPCSVLIVTKRWCKKFAPIPILYYSCQKFAVTFCFDSKKLLLIELREVLAVHWKNCTHPPPLLLQWTVHAFVMSRTFAPSCVVSLQWNWAGLSSVKKCLHKLISPFNTDFLTKCMSQAINVTDDVRVLTDGPLE